MSGYKIDVCGFSIKDKELVQSAAFNLGCTWSCGRVNQNLRALFYYLEPKLSYINYGMDVATFVEHRYKEITLQQLLKLADMEGNMSFTKSDLKDGMVVRTKDGGYGDHYLVIGDKLLGNGYCNLSNFERDLTCSSSSDFDIMEVYSAKTTGGIYDLKDLLVPRNLTSIWKREEKSATQIELEKLQQQIADLQAQANKLQSTL